MTGVGCSSCAALLVSRSSGHFSLLSSRRPLGRLAGAPLEPTGGAQNRTHNEKAPQTSARASARPNRFQIGRRPSTRGAVVPVSLLWRVCQPARRVRRIAIRRRRTLGGRRGSSGNGEMRHEWLLWAGSCVQERAHERERVRVRAGPKPRGWRPIASALHTVCTAQCMQCTMQSAMQRAQCRVHSAHCALMLVSSASADWLLRLGPHDHFHCSAQSGERQCPRRHSPGR